MSGPTPEQFGAYLVYEQLGVGGMASVHVAESRGPGGFRKRVALKRLLDHAAHQPQLVELFVGEARLAQYLHHGNIAQTFDVGTVKGTYYIAMELVAGPTLKQLLRQVKSTIGVIPFPITLAIVRQLLDALDYAHNLLDREGVPLGIIHRDVTPPNVIISNSGVVKLIDFGLAKARTAHVKSDAGVIKGKFSYVAPEYLRGKLDSRCDLWSVGAMAHELLTGDVLFQANSDLDVLERVKSLPIPAPSRTNRDVPPELDAIILTALERDPEQRWQSAAAMRTAITNIATELQTEITNGQLAQWVEWAFTQTPPGERSELSQLIKTLEAPSRPSGRLSDPKLFDLGTAAKERPEGRLPVLPTLNVDRQSRIVITLVALVVIGAGITVLWYVGLLS